MNQKTITNRFKPLLLIAFVFLFGQSAVGQLVTYSLGTNGNQTSGTNGNSGGVLTTTAANLEYASSTSATTTGWDSSTGTFRYYEISNFSTLGYFNIGVSATMKSELGGPKDFQLQYSLNSGASWTPTGTMAELTTIDGIRSVLLPSACHNQATVKLRWIATSYLAVGGGNVTSAKKNYIRLISVSGNNADQAYGITFVSITPRTIRVSCVPGNGERRIIKCNTTNTFTDPVDGFNAGGVTAEYLGAPTNTEQIVYDGNGSEVTVTINSAPYSNTVLWFRVYDYRLNGGDTRYITTTIIDSNPRKCELEYIDVKPVTNLRLTSASMNAEILTPIKSDINDRGVVWSYTSPVDEASNLTSYSPNIPTDGGTFSVNVASIDRGQATIYYKAFVENTSGKIYSEEYEFTNIPTFTNGGVNNYWATPGNWNVNEAPGALNGVSDEVHGNIVDNPVINGNCEVDGNYSITNLTINNTKKLSINSAKTFTVAGTLTNNATTSGLVVKAGNVTTANASLIFSNKALNQNVPASVEMYSKASTAGGNHWQYFGVPVQSQTVSTTFGGSERVRRFNEANFDASGEDKGLWYPYPALTMDGTETLLPVVGYEVVQTSAKTYTFKGNLNAADFNHPLAYTTVPQLADYAGQNIIANPYTAAINISGLGFGSAEATAYLYNTGSREEWTSNNGASTPGTNPGTYIAVPSALAGSLGIPSQIPSMQGFLVKTLEPTSINIPYSSVVTNTAPQRAPVMDQKVATMIDVIGSKSSDRMWIFSLPTCTRNYDNGFDGRKILGYNTQIFAMEGSEDYQIDAVNDINNTYLGFQSGSETNLKLIFTHQNLEDKYSRVYLTDLVENKIIDITASGTEYVFTAVPSTTPSQRFKITTSTTDNVTPNAGEQIKIFGSNGNAIVQNLSNAKGNVFIYTMAGQFVRNVPFNANGVTTISNLKAGAYIVKAKTAAKEVNSYLIIR